jgi:hypothetical protein
MVRRATLAAATLLLAGTVAAQTSFDGSWKPSIKFAPNSEIQCTGFVFDSQVTITDGKISGTISHSEAGTFELSGSVQPDGTLQGFQATGSAVVESRDGSTAPRPAARGSKNTPSARGRGLSPSRANVLFLPFS